MLGRIISGLKHIKYEMAIWFSLIQVTVYFFLANTFRCFLAIKIISSIFYRSTWWIIKRKLLIWYWYLYIPFYKSFFFEKKNCSLIIWLKTTLILDSSKQQLNQDLEGYGVSVHQNHCSIISWKISHKIFECYSQN